MTDEEDKYGAVVIEPEPPRRGTFTLIVPIEMTWESRENGGAVRLDFRPRTPLEMAQLWKDKGRL
ncbi:MAG: hypothetical protein H6716_28670 [Polyangiaceae bacterium]|nr:hypothetical protein [Polyangiaceae bacterium]